MTGNRNSGRKSAYKEHKAAKIVADAFVNGISLQKIADETEKKNVKLIYYAIDRALKSDKVLTELLKKILPDKIEQTGGDENEDAKVSAKDAAAISAFFESMQKERASIKDQIKTINAKPKVKAKPASKKAKEIQERIRARQNRKSSKD